MQVSGFILSFLFLPQNQYFLDIKINMKQLKAVEYLLEKKTQSVH